MLKKKNEMKRPEKYIGNALGWNKAYKCTDIDPLLDELEALQKKTSMNNTCDIIFEQAGNIHDNKETI